MMQTTGPPGVNWKGTWSSGATYNLNDGVTYNGSSYLSTLSLNTGTPGESGWTVIAQAGAPGPNCATNSPAGTCDLGTTQLKTGTVAAGTAPPANAPSGALISNGQLVLPASGLWSRVGTVLRPSIPADQGVVMEPSVLVPESGCTLVTSPCWKMLFDSGTSTPNVYYAEAPAANPETGWVRTTTPVIANHARVFLLENAPGDYRAFVSGNPQIDEYQASSAAGPYVLLYSAVVLSDIAWNVNSVNNTSGVWSGGTFYLFVEGQNASGTDSIGIYTSTDLHTFTAYSGNPIIQFPLAAVGGPSVPQLVGSIWYMWLHGSPEFTVGLPDDIYRMQATSLTGPWTNSLSGPDLVRTGADEGQGLTWGQIADPFNVSYNGQTYLFYSADTDGRESPGNGTIKLAIAGAGLSGLAAFGGGPVSPWQMGANSDQNHAAPISYPGQVNIGVTVNSFPGGEPQEIGGPSLAVGGSTWMNGYLYLGDYENAGLINFGIPGNSAFSQGGLRWWDGGTYGTSINHPVANVLTISTSSQEVARFDPSGYAWFEGPAIALGASTNLWFGLPGDTTLATGCIAWEETSGHLSSICHPSNGTLNLTAGNNLNLQVNATSIFLNQKVTADYAGYDGFTVSYPGAATGVYASLRLQGANSGVVSRIKSTFGGSGFGNQLAFSVGSSDTIVMSVQDNPAESSYYVQIPTLHSTTGTRYVCVDTNGDLTSSAAICSGT
ncbi:MAG: hypothetical protein P4K93_07620 [Terracidiphilus sp.]|nr:hypothetical protein [Terracidiphilus sp.]